MGSVRITGAGAAPLDGIGLAIAQSEIGDCLALHFSEDSGSRDSWSFRVIVHTDEGVYALGDVITRPPAAGVLAARTVALAFCPGARGWTVIPSGPAGATGILVLSTSKECTGGGAALAPLVGVNGSQVSSRTWPPPVLGATQGVIIPNAFVPGAPVPATLTKLFGFIDLAAPFFPCYFMLFDKAAALIPGDLPRVAPVPLTAAGQVWSLSFDPDGIAFVNGIRWALSASPLAFAVGAGADLAYVSGEVK